MRRLAYLWILAAVLLADSRASAAECPKGATWQGAPPPRGDGYFCAKTGSSGDLVRHGWSVLFDRLTTFKREECEYRDDQLNGRCTRYDAEGERAERGYYEQGKRARDWWFWSLPSADATRRIRLSPPPTEPEQLVQRRMVVQALFVELGAGDAEAQGLAQHVVAYVDDPAAERRVVCGDHICVGPGRGSEPIYVQIGVAAAAVERDRVSLSELQTRAAGAAADETKLVEAAVRKAAADEKRKIKEYRSAVVRYKKLRRQWDYTSLRCNDGQRSPSCTCGGSWQGCCSWHGGVDGCPREEPTAPVAPPGVQDELSESD